jgi:hypothetical protein
VPNTIIHIGINGFVTRSVINKADLLLIYIGSVLPDLPWIIQRAIPVFYPSINLYDLRIYCIVLASLLFCIVMSFAIAILFKETNRIALILSLGALLHLILDSLETKWGNGVHFFAPINWELRNFGYFWPENIITYILIGFGLIYILLNWRETISTILVISLNPKKILLFILCVIFYFSLPLLFVSSVELADNHFVKTLRNVEQRVGKYFETDRGYFKDLPNQDKFITPFYEELKVTNLNLNSSESMSIRAKFVSKYEIQIIEYRIHNNRDLFSYFGLFLLLVLITITILKRYRIKINL